MPSYIAFVDRIMVLMVAVEVILYYLQSSYKGKLEYNRGAK
jgi:hypothetical protein